jgi:RNA polymerase sigma-70 factor (sigma-E family)
LRGYPVLLCDVTDIAPTLGGAGDAVNARDRTQFDEFMASRWPGLVRLAFGLTGDRWLAEDLAQTALASAYAAWWRVRRADDPDAYVRRILINASKSRFRRHQLSEQPSEPGDLPDPEVADAAADVGERSALLTALAELPPRQRAVVVLRYVEDMTDTQVGALLGCSASTVRSQAARALAKLRASEQLAEQDSSAAAPRQQEVPGESP